MQSSQPGGGPRILHCPNCGAPIDAPAYAQSARCTYCHQTVVLAVPNASATSPQAPAPYTPAPYTPAPYAPVPYASVPHQQRQMPTWISRLLFRLAAAVIVLGVSSAWVALTRPDAPASASPAQPVQAQPAKLSVPVPQARAAAAAAPTVVKYSLSSLSRINATTVNVDGAEAHMLALFPNINSEKRSDVLSFKVPLNDPWFKEAELNWKNEKNGMIQGVALRPAGEGWFRNQKEVADCLAKSLGKPKEQEVNHLSHETSYIFLAHWPKASVDVYASYLWLSFEDSTGVGTVTFANVVKTLDGCSSHAK